jgi:hypothetical protein
MSAAYGVSDAPIGARVRIEAADFPLLTGEVGTVIAHIPCVMCAASGDGCGEADAVCRLDDGTETYVSVYGGLDA